MKRSEAATAANAAVVAESLEPGLVLLRADGSLGHSTPSAEKAIGCGGRDDLVREWPSFLERMRAHVGQDLEKVDSAAFCLPATGAAEGLDCSLGRLDSFGHFLVVRDCAMARTLAAELRTSSHYLALSRLFSAIAHELRGPLHTIVLNVELLKRMTPELCDDGTLGALDVMQRELASIRTIFDSFSRQSAATDPAPVPFDVARMLFDLSDVLRRFCAKRKVELRFDRIERPVSYVGVRDDLRVAVLHLAMGVVEALWQDGRLLVEVEERGNGVRLELHGTATALAEEAATRMWNFDSDAAPCGPESGLSVLETRAIVAQHGGRMSVVRESGSSIRVAVELPDRADGD